MPLTDRLTRWQETAPADLARLTDNPDAHRGRWQWQETG